MDTIEKIPRGSPLFLSLPLSLSLSLGLRHFRQNLMHNSNNHAWSAWLLVMALAFYAVLTIFTYGIAVPSGLFIPAFIVGGTFLPGAPLLFLICRDSTTSTNTHTHTHPKKEPEHHERNEDRYSQLRLTGHSFFLRRVVLRLFCVFLLFVCGWWSAIASGLGQL